MTEEPFSFDEPLEWRLVGSPEMVRSFLITSAGVLEWEAHEFRLTEIDHEIPRLVVDVFLPGGRYAGEIGHIYVDGLPGTKTRLVVPRGRGAARLQRDWRSDPEGRLFSAYLKVGA